MLAALAQLNGAPVGVDQLAALALAPYGHFTTMLVDGGRVRGLALHLDRLVRDCRALFDADLDPAHVCDLVRRAVPATGRCATWVTVFDPALQDAFDHEVRPVRSSDVCAMRAAFATNAAFGVRPIVAVDGTELDPAHPVMALLREAYAGVPADDLVPPLSRRRGTPVRSPARPGPRRGR